jgi:hypothetical protein
VFLRRQRFKLATGAKDKERAMSQTPKTVGIDIGKNSFHVVGHDERGAIVLRKKWSRGQLEVRLPTCRRVWSARRYAEAIAEKRWEREML